jgi:hypothetical protein
MEQAEISPPRMTREKKRVTKEKFERIQSILAGQLYQSLTSLVKVALFSYNG